MSKYEFRYNGRFNGRCKVKEVFEGNIGTNIVCDNYELVDAKTGLNYLRHYIDLETNASGEAIPSERIDEWIAANESLFFDGFIIGYGVNIDIHSPNYYNALDKPDILNYFQVLGHDFRVTELDFAKTYGLLGFMQKKVVKELGIMNTRPALPSVEPLSWFREQQEEYITTVVDIYHCLTEDHNPALVRTYLQQTALYVKDLLPTQRMYEKWFDGSNELLKLSIAFARLLEQKLSDARPTIHAQDIGKFSFGYASDTLIDSIYLMFWRQITLQKELKTCPGCGAKFFIEPKRGRKPKYHSVACEEAAKQRRYSKKES